MNGIEYSKEMKQIIFSSLIFSMILMIGCAKTDEKIGENSVRGSTPIEVNAKLNQYLSCSANSDCGTKKVSERNVNTGATIISVPLYVCINSQHINSELITKDWALTNKIEISDMLEQKCSCIQNLCKIYPIGVPPPPK